MVSQRSNKRHPLDIESKEKYEHMLEKREESAENLKKSMISHLSALNDGVIATFITVMMLEIQYPRLQTEFKSFLWSIAVFLVSFFIVAEFWYDNKASGSVYIFASIKTDVIQKSIKFD